MNTTDRAAQYLEKLPPSIQGSGGSAALFEAACVLIRGFGLSPEDALPILAHWNETHCQPKWSEHELRYKLRSALQSTRPMGYLLGNPSLLHAGLDEAQGRRQRREQWPAFRPLLPPGRRAIAELRTLPIAAVELAHGCGLLAGAEIDGHRSFVIREGSFAQARRLDGKPFVVTSGVTKAKNLAGAEGAFIGQGHLGESAHILLVEGCIGWLEAVAAILITDRTDWTVLAATSAASRFRRDPALLSKLAGRRIRILPDLDEAGQDAAASWLADMESVGCQVDAHPLPTGIKDLGPLVADPASHHQTLSALFQ